MLSSSSWLFLRPSRAKLYTNIISPASSGPNSGSSPKTKAFRTEAADVQAPPPLRLSPANLKTSNICSRGQSSLKHSYRALRWFSKNDPSAHQSLCTYTPKLISLKSVMGKIGTFCLFDGHSANFPFPEIQPTVAGDGTSPLNFSPSYVLHS